MADYLGQNISSFTNIPYNELKLYFVTYGIMTYEEKRSLDHSGYNDEKSLMCNVLGNIRFSLHCGQTKPFKAFLKLLEESGDNHLQEKAKTLG